MGNTGHVFELLKFFLDKKFFLTIISISIALICFLVIPSNFWMTEKIGFIGLFVLIFCLSILVLSIVRALWDTICKVINGNRYKKKLEVENERKNLKNLWDIVDGFNEYELNLILEFLQNNNKPKLAGEYFYVSGNIPSNWVVMGSLTVPIFEKMYIDKSTHKEVSKDQVNGSETILTQKLTKQYKLEENVYEILQYSQKKYNRISNFESNKL